MGCFNFMGYNQELKNVKWTYKEKGSKSSCNKSLFKKKFKCRNWKNKLVLDFRIQTYLKLYMMFLCLPRICVSSLQNISQNLPCPSMCVWLVASFALVFGMWNSSSRVLMLGSNSIIWNSRMTFNPSLNVSIYATNNNM